MNIIFDRRHDSYTLYYPSCSKKSHGFNPDITYSCSDSIKIFAEEGWDIVRGVIFIRQSSLRLSPLYHSLFTLNVGMSRLISPRVVTRDRSLLLLCSVLVSNRSGSAPPLHWSFFMYTFSPFNQTRCYYKFSNSLNRS